MPVKRAIMIKVERDVLTYALRADVPSGLEKPKPRYRSSYGDPNDPDQAAIQSGTVVEVFRTISVKPDPAETKSQLVQRVQGNIEQAWTSFQARVTQSPKSKDVLGRFWDGSEWAAWSVPMGEPPEPL